MSSKLFCRKAKRERDLLLRWRRSGPHTIRKAIPYEDRRTTA